MTGPLDLLAGRVRERVRREGLDLAGDPGAAERVVREEIRRYSERALGGADPLLDDEAAAEREVLAAVAGFGALQPLLDDPEVEEVWINAPDGVFATPTPWSSLVAAIFRGSADEKPSKQPLR